MQQRACHIGILWGVALLLAAFVACGLLIGCAQEPEQPQQEAEPEFKAELLEPDTLTVLVPLDYPPFSAGSADDPWGYDIAVAQEIANRLGVSVELVPTDRATILQQLTGEFSLAASSSTSTPADENSADASSLPNAQSSATTNGAESASSPSAETDSADESGTASAPENAASTPNKETETPEPEGDIAIAALAITDDREEVVDFTSWYYVGNQAVVVRDGVFASTTEFDSQKTRIAVVSGSTCKQTAEGLTSEKLVAEYSTAEKCLQALEAKEVQAVVLDLPVAQYLIAHDFSHDRIIERIMTGETYSIALRSESSHLKDAINEVLSVMEKDGTLERLESEQLKRSY